MGEECYGSWLPAKEEEEGVDPRSQEGLTLAAEVRRLEEGGRPM